MHRIWAVGGGPLYKSGIMRKPLGGEGCSEEEHSMHCHHTRYAILRPELSRRRSKLAGVPDELLVRAQILFTRVVLSSHFCSPPSNSIVSQSSILSTQQQHVHRILHVPEDCDRQSHRCSRSFQRSGPRIEQQRSQASCKSSACQGDRKEAGARLLLLLFLRLVDSLSRVLTVYASSPTHSKSYSSSIESKEREGEGGL